MNIHKFDQISYINNNIQHTYINTTITHTSPPLGSAKLRKAGSKGDTGVGEGEAASAKPSLRRDVTEKHGEYDGNMFGIIMDFPINSMLDLAIVFCMFTRPGIPLHIPLPSGYLLHNHNGFSHGTVMDFTVISPKMEKTKTSGYDIHSLPWKNPPCY